MTKAQIQLPPKLIPVFTGKAPVRGSHGGRGSGKTRSFALMAAVRGYMFARAGINGVILCGREYMNSLEDSSMEEVKQAIAEVDWLADFYDVGQKYIRSKCGSIHFVFAGLRHNLDSIKSKARILIAWVDEAENVSEVAWKKLIPTIRGIDDAELWVTWNPEKKDSPTDKRFRQSPPEGAKIVELNYTDNPWFPPVLERARLDDQRRLSPEEYAWIWQGAYLMVSDAVVFKGKYIVEDFEPLDNWDGAYYGLDFGFSLDPTAAIECYIADRKLWIRRDCGKVGLELDETADYIKRHFPGLTNQTIRADSARPESISYLKRQGLPGIKPVEKGKGSVEDGIEFMRSFDQIVIHPDAKHCQHEFMLYSYKVDRLSGDITTTLEDANNHFIDAIRYALEPIMKRSKLAKGVRVST